MWIEFCRPVEEGCETKPIHSWINLNALLKIALN